MPDLQALLATNEKLSRELLGPRGDEVDQARQFPRTTLRRWERLVCLACLRRWNLAARARRSRNVAGVGVQSQHCASTAMITLMHFCATVVIAAKGSDALKERILPAAASGGHLSTLAFSEAGSGGHFYCR